MKWWYEKSTTLSHVQSIYSQWLIKQSPFPLAANQNTKPVEMYYKST